MKKVVFAVLILLLASLAVSAYKDPSAVVDGINRLIEKSLGIEEATVEDLKRMAEEGKIQYEVYRLALYRKLQDPTLFYKVVGGKVYVWEYDRLKNQWNGGRGNLWNHLLTGRYVEKINDTWLRVVVVGFDERFTKKYFIVKVDLSTELESGYVVDNWWPSYLRTVSEGKYGTWYKRGINWEVDGAVEYRVVENSNPVDMKIAEDIARQIEKFAEENGLSMAQATLIVLDEFTDPAIRYSEEDPWAKPFTVQALDGDELSEVYVEKTDSMMKAFLMNGRGSCFVLTMLPLHVLNAMGVPAHAFAVPLVDKYLGKIYHAVVAIPYSGIDIKEVERCWGKIRPLKINFGREDECWMVYDAQNRVTSVSTEKEWMWAPALLIKFNFT